MLATLRRGSAPTPAILAAVLTIILFVLAILPLARLALEAFAGVGEARFFAAAAVLAAPATQRALVTSLITAFGGTAIAVLLGTALALAVSLTDIRARNLFVFCLVLPLMIAPQVTALAFLQLLGPSSPILRAFGIAPPLGARNPLYSEGGIIALLGVQYAPLMMIVLGAQLRTLPQALVEAARAAGASPLAIVRTVILPILLPAFLAGSALVFVSCFGNFGIPALLGTPANLLTLPTLIYQLLSGQGPSVLPRVAVLSLLVGLIAALGLVVQGLVAGRRTRQIEALSRPLEPFRLGGLRPVVEAALILAVLLMLVLPLAGLVASALVGGLGVRLSLETLTLANFSYVLFEHAAARRALVNSFALSLGAGGLIVLIALPLGYLAVIRRWRPLAALATIAEIPYAVPGVVLAIAAILLFLRPLPLIGFALYNTPWIILFAYLSRFMVLGLRPIIGGFQQFDRALDEAAEIAGAGLVRRLVTIVAPVLTPVTAAGFLLIVLTAFNELTVSALLWSSGSETLGVVLFSFEQGGDAGLAAAIAVLTTLVVAGLMLLASLFAGRLPRGTLPWRI